MKYDNCLICGTKKSQFVNLSTGSGFLNDAIGKLGNLGIELHFPAEKGENIPNGTLNNLRKYSYAGLGTKYLQMVQEEYECINELDRVAKLHDKFYNEHSDTKSRKISDTALAHRAEEISNEISNDLNIDDAQRRDAKFVKTLMENNAKFGLGIMKTNKTPKN